MQQEQVYPVYKHCTGGTIQGQVGQMISIMGKVIETRPQQSIITIEINPETSKTLRITIPAITIDYLLEYVDLGSLKEKEDLLLAQKYINFCQSEKGNGNYKEYGTPSSLMWFTVEKGDIYNKDKAAIEQNNSNLPTSLIKNISANSFSLNQYIQVRGKCLDSKTLEMIQFTDLQDNFDIHSYNNAVNLLIKNCKQLLQ